MTDPGPGDRQGSREPRASREAPGPRRLAQPPSARYGGGNGSSGEGGRTSGGADAARSALPGPLARALVIGAAGAGVLVVVGALLASTAGLLFASGATGAGVGLVLARAAVPRGDARPVARRTVVWLALVVSIGAVAAAAVATWLVARNEGGTLGLLDFLWTTFGPFVPGEALVAALAAAWGAAAGPVQS